VEHGMEIAYAGSKGTKLYEFRNANEVAPSADPNADVASRRQWPYLGDFSLWCSCNSSHYHSLQTKLEKRLSYDLSFLTAYTFGKAIDEVSQASLGFHGGGRVRSSNHPSWEKGRADFDVTHRIVNSLSYTLPIGKRKRFASGLHGVGEALLGGWELQGIQAAQTGIPLTVTASIRESNTAGGAGERPNRVKGAPLYPSNRGPSLWFNPAAFTATAFGTYGNSGRNIFSSAPQVTIDTSLFKDFYFKENAAHLQFRSEFFNVLNHPNFRADSMNYRFDQAGGGSYNGAQPSRQIQFALKLIY
jgi:hypothetical protein